MTTSEIATIHNDTSANFTERTTLVGRFAMDEGSGQTAHDSSIYGNDGCISGATWNNNVLDFDGDGDYVSISGSSLFDVATDSTYIFSFWVYPYSITGYHVLFSKADASLSGDCGYCINLKDNKVQLTYNDGSTVPQAQKTSSITISQNTWQHISLTIDRNAETVTFYKNGESAESYTLSRPGNWAKSEDPLIGALTPTIWEFDGQIKDVRIFKGALTSNEVSELYSSKRYYVSPDGNDSADGSINNPWKTIAKVNATTLNPGDTILFEKGNIWRESLIIDNSGTPSNPITFDAYGSGDAPVIAGCDLITA